VLDAADITALDADVTMDLLPFRSYSATRAAFKAYPGSCLLILALPSKGRRMGNGEIKPWDDQSGQTRNVQKVQYPNRGSCDVVGSVPPSLGALASGFQSHFRSCGGGGAESWNIKSYCAVGGHSAHRVCTDHSPTQVCSNRLILSLLIFPIFLTGGGR